MTGTSRLNLSGLAKTLKRNTFGMMLVRAYRFFFHWYYWGLPKFASWRGGGRLEISEMTYRLGSGIIVRASNGGVVKIGKQVTLRRFITLHAFERIEIGDYSRIGEMVTIRDHNHFSELADAPGDSKGFQSAPVIIGKNVWVGVKVTMMPGVTVGDNAVIGANAVVTKDIPANAVAVGIPAKVIRIQTASKPSSEGAR
jgi:acetyltransferase-like isoleucine patch superfamily enzyme